MTLPDALDHDLTAELAGLSRSTGLLSSDRPAGSPTGGGIANTPTAAPTSAQAGRPRRMPSVQGVKSRVRAQAVRQASRVILRLGQAGASRQLVEPFITERTAPLIGHVDDLGDWLATLSAQVAALTAERSQSAADRINFSLLKNDVIAISGRVDEVLAEMREQERRLLDLGMAFAPGAGLGGAAVRFAELREQINSVERRLRYAPAAAAIDGSADATPAAQPEPIVATDLTAQGQASTVVAANSVTSELFNYVAFERRFRGDPEAILAVQTERYSELLSANRPVVDMGCGRAELLERLQSQGVECIGVDTDSGMVAEGRARGLDIRHTDALAFLEQASEHSIGSVFSAHLVEHLQLDVLIRFLELSAAKLKPGGVFIAETPNPASLIVLGNSYILDPTHVRPLHPSLLAFLCETAGFRDVRLEFYSPASSYHLSEVRDADAPEWVRTINTNTERLNEVLFGPQEYAVIATTPS